jgi:hypothetical protein
MLSPDSPWGFTSVRTSLREHGCRQRDNVARGPGTTGEGEDSR